MLSISKSLPGTDGLPFVGETVPFVSDIHAFLASRIARHGPVFRTHLLRLPTVITASYNATTHVLTSDDYNAHTAYQEFLSDLFPSSIPLLLPSHHPSRLSSLQVLHHSIRSALPALSESQPPLIRKFWHRHTLRHPHSLPLYHLCKTLCRTTLVSALLHPLHHDDVSNLVIQASVQLNGIAATPLAIRAFGSATARARAQDAYRIMSRIVRNRLSQPAPLENDQNARSCSVADHVARAVTQRHISLDDATASVVVMLNAAVTKALASASFSTILSLAHHSARNDAPPDVDDAILEALRLFPPIAGIMRRTTQDQAGQLPATPAHWRVWASLYHANRDQAVYKHPLQFRPDRWHSAPRSPNTCGCPFASTPQHKPLSSTSHTTAQSTPMMPLSFGVGDRQCLGKDLAWLIIRHVVIEFRAHFSIQVDPNLSEWDPQLRYLPVLRAADDSPVPVTLNI